MSANPVVERLNQLLGSASVFARKTRHFHWNVKGRSFFTLHAEFEKLYGEWSEFGDALAERVVALGGRPLATLADDLKHSKLKEETQGLDADAMVRALVADMEALKAAILEASASAETAEDRTTADLLDDLRDALDKKLWMFKAYLT